MREVTELPRPDADAVQKWINQHGRLSVHHKLWQRANQHFSGYTSGLRTFINREYDDPAMREGVYDGISMTLAALEHFNNQALIEHLQHDFLSTSFHQPKIDKA